MRYGVRSAADCENQCWRESTCSRFVFITDTQLIGDPNRVCYLFSSRDTAFIERPGGTLYFRRRCLPMDTCVPMTTTSKSRSLLLESTQCIVVGLDMDPIFLTRPTAQVAQIKPEFK